MSSQAQPWQKEAEALLLENLRARYENEGYKFVAHPSVDDLPSFLRGYQPDAVAKKSGRNVAIELKKKQSAYNERKISEIRQLFEGRSDWQFQVVFLGEDPLQSVNIPATSPSEVLGRTDEVRELAAKGHHRAAFIVAWALLEAALRALDGKTDSRPRSPGTVVQTLAMHGHLDPDTDRQMRRLVDVRNRVVHGDLAAEPSTADIDLILSAVRQALNAESSHSPA